MMNRNRTSGFIVDNMTRGIVQKRASPSTAAIDGDGGIVEAVG